MRRIAYAAGLVLFLLVLGAAHPGGASDRDLIIRLQGEILVLQRQVRDLQETIDKHQATSSQVVTKMAENTEASGKILTSLQERINQTDNLQHNSLSGVVKRLAHLEEGNSQANAQLIEISRTLKEIKTAMATQPVR